MNGKLVFRGQGGKMASELSEDRKVRRYNGKSVIEKLLFLFLLMFTLPAYSYEECIVSSNSKLTNIKIEYNDIINVYPLITLANDKNILMVEPLKEGSTRFKVTKNKNDESIFTVEVNADSTIIKGDEDFEIITLDVPPEIYEYAFEIDKLPEEIWTN